MESTVKLIVSDGIGGQMLALSVSDLLLEKGYKVEFLSIARDEVFRVVKSYAAGIGIEAKQLPESDEEKYLKSELPSNTYLLWPDLLFQHPKSFPFEKFGLTLPQIRSNRFLRDDYKPENIIYCALNTSTPQYVYDYKKELIKQLAIANPNYKVYFNVLSKWNNKDLNPDVFENFPDNCIIKYDEDFYKSLEYLNKSIYCVCLDNGISHLAYFIGIPRLLLSKHNNLNSLKFLSRWFETTEESIGYEYSPKEIAQLVRLNIQLPQTTLIPRQIVMNNLNSNWRELLYFKY